MGFGYRIKEYRKAIKKKGNEFAALVGISPSSLSELESEKNDPKADTLEKIVRNTEINAKWLLTGEGVMVGMPSEVYLSKDETRLLSAFRELNEHDQVHQLATIESLADKERLLREKDGLVGALENLSGDAAAAKRISEKAAAEHARKKKIADASDKEHSA